MMRTPMKRAGTGMVPATTSPSGVRERVLLVDDDDLVRGALEILLGERFDIVTAASAEEAVQHFASGRYRLLITDLGLPRAQGDELARALRLSDPHLSTMLITGQDLEADDPRLEGFDTWMQKPFLDLDEVIGRVQRLMETSRLRRAG